MSFNYIERERCFFIIGGEGNKCFVKINLNLVRVNMVF